MSKVSKKEQMLRAMASEKFKMFMQEMERQNIQSLPGEELFAQAFMAGFCEGEAMMKGARKIILKTNGSIN